MARAAKKDYRGKDAKSSKDDAVKIATGATDDASGKNEALAGKWKRELAVAHKREKDFLKYGEKVIKRYRNEEKRQSAYNVLWANTEVLRPALYNSKPEPDVRRRFRDADPLGKAVGDVLDRSLCVMLDGDATDGAFRNDVLDSLLPGRGISRIRYVARLSEAAAPKPEGDKGANPRRAAEEKADEADKHAGDDTGIGGSLPPEAGEGSYEQVEFEQAIIEHVDWRDFRHGFGRVWAEVPWVGFRHQLIRADAVKKFGEEALGQIEFMLPQVEDEKKYRAEGGAGTTKVAEFWEIWDKEGEQVFFINENSKTLLYPLDNPDGDVPLDLEGFFPCPEPLMLIENTGSLDPIAMFSLYETQANQLDKITARIDKIVAALRLRGVYDAKITELRDLVAADDNELTPTQNAALWAQAGGLDKAIAWMPVEQAATVLTALYDARDRQKRIIDELLGISDIVRGATDPDETLGAQNLKQSNYSVRLRRMQDAVKRYVRDLMRLGSQVMSRRFEADTFRAMTDLKFPTDAERQLLAQRLQMLQQPQAAQVPQPQPMPGASPPGPQAGAASPPAGPPPGPPPQMLQQLQQQLQVPTWEQIIGMMRSPAMELFRIDVETDSMIANTLDADMKGLAQVLQSVEQLLTGLAPLVQSGALPIDAAKELVMAVIRRARMGSAVEDAFEKMQVPKPPPQPPHPAQIKAQADMQMAQLEGQVKQGLEQMKQDGETRRQQMEDAARGQREQMLEQMKSHREMFETKLDGAIRIIIATISATKQRDPAVQPAADSTEAALLQS